MTLLFILFTLTAVLTVIIFGRLGNDKKKYVPVLDKDMTLVLKGLMIVFLLVGHTCNFVINDSTSWWVNNLSSFGVYAVSMFLFMSGYGLMISLEKKGEGYLEGFLVRRLSKILVPLIVATILFLPVNFFVQEQSWLDIGEAFSRGVPPLRFSWFAYMIVVAYLIFFLCAKKLEYGWKLITGVSILLLLFALILYSIGWKEHWYATCLSIPLGMCISLYRKEVGSFFVNRTGWCIALTFVAMAVTYVSGVIGLSYWLISFTVPFCFYIYIYIWSFFDTKVIRFLGKYSYEIYLCHGAFITICSKYTHDANLLIVSLFISVFIIILMSIALRWVCNQIESVALIK